MGGFFFLLNFIFNRTVEVEMTSFVPSAPLSSCKFSVIQNHPSFFILNNDIMGRTLFYKTTLLVQRRPLLCVWSGRADGALRRRVQFSFSHRRSPPFFFFEKWTMTQNPYHSAPLIIVCICQPLQDVKLPERHFVSYFQQ